MNGQYFSKPLTAYFADMLLNIVRIWYFCLKKKNRIKGDNLLEKIFDCEIIPVPFHYCCVFFLISGAVLLDLEQTTLPGIAHLVVETMIISDQIKAEDRANVLRALLLKHR